MIARFIVLHQDYKKKANEFKNLHKAQKAFESYSELFKDDETVIVYIATPHNSHMQLSIEAMENGKHVLCEKPLGINKMQVQKMIDASKKNGVFLMEAFWSKFNPAVSSAIQKAKDGTIGKV